MHVPHRLEEARETYQEIPLPLRNCLCVEDEGLNPYRLGKSQPLMAYVLGDILQIDIS